MIYCLVLAAAFVADVASTFWALHRGRVEANPLLRRGFWLALAIKAAIVGAVSILSVVVLAEPRWLLVPAIAMFAAAGWNTLRVRMRNGHENR